MSGNRKTDLSGPVFIKQALEGEGGFAGKARALQKALPKLSGEAYSANGRTVKTLLKRSGYGDMPTYMSDAWGADDKGKAEVTDLLGQLEDAAPKAAGALRNQLAQKLAPAERGLLFAAAAIRRLAEDDEKPEDKPEKKPEKEPDKPEKPDPEKPDPEKERRCLAVTGRIKAEENRLNGQKEFLQKAEEAVKEAEESLRIAEQELAAFPGKVAPSLSGSVFSRGLIGFITGAAILTNEYKEKETAVNEVKNELVRVRGDVERLNGVIVGIKAKLEELRNEQEEVCGEKDEKQTQRLTNYS